MLYEESDLVIERLNGAAATQAVLVQAAIASMFSKEGGKLFSKLIKRMGADGQ